jgi:hypothetical protein
MDIRGIMNIMWVIEGSEIVVTHYKWVDSKHALDLSESILKTGISNLARELWNVFARCKKLCGERKSMHLSSSET